MPQMILKVKLQKPSLPVNLIVKDEATARFKDSKIIIISAGAGTGKSTLVSSWLETQILPFIWFSIDEWDNALPQFLMYIATALADIENTVSIQMLQLIESRQNIDDDSLIRAFISILQTITSPLILVLDDYHYIYEQKIHVFMRALIEHLPHSMKLCILSREDPPLPLSRLRLQRNMTELRMVDLRFTQGDAEKLLTAYLTKPLTQNQIDHIYSRTEGWVSGLLFTAFALQDIDDVDAFVQSFSKSQQYIMDYLLEEVLERQSDEMKDFLLATSIFEYFTAQMCEEILALKLREAARMIDLLVKSNSFMIVLEGDEFAYRYHHLFKALLLKRFEARPSVYQKDLYKRAGDWYQTNSRYKEAIEKYLAGGIFHEAAALIEQLWSEMDLSLQSSSWFEMAKKLPETLLSKSPVLSMGCGWALLNTGDVMGCLPWFETAKALYERWSVDALNEEILVYDQDELIQMPATLMSAEAYIAALNGEYGDLIVKTNALQQLADKYSYKRQWQVNTFLTSAYWGNGDVSSALEMMIQVSNETRGLLNPLFHNSFKLVMSDLLIQMGQLTKAGMVIEEAIDEMHREGIVPLMLANFYLYLALIAAYRGKLDMAFEHLEASKSFSHQFEFMDWRHKYNALLSRLYITEGLWRSAELCVEEGKLHVFNDPIPESFIVDDMALWLSLAQEKDNHALRVRIEVFLEANNAYATDEASSVSGMNDKKSNRRIKLPVYSDEMKWKIMMRYAPVEVYSEKFGVLCGKLIARATVQKRWIAVIEFTLLKMRFESGKAEREALMASALRLSEKEGLKLPFMEFGEWPNDVQRSTIRRKSALANQSISEPLTARELEILELIAKGLSNQEIADTLFIALSTVKSYNNNLFGKLEVSRRTEAVAKAKALGIV
ncbi:LuxR C-terminal-related transcriptional regulator [Fusibacter bizertensis]